MRQFLNGAFFDAFSEQERSCIAETKIRTNNNPWFGTDGGGITNDRIFVLSIEGVVHYFGDSGKLKHKAQTEKGAWVIDDEFNSARVAVDAIGAPRRWWLRTPGQGQQDAASVLSNGCILMNGSFVAMNPAGVRPAMWVNV